MLRTGAVHTGASLGRGMGCKAQGMTHWCCALGRCTLELYHTPAKYKGSGRNPRALRTGAVHTGATPRASPQSTKRAPQESVAVSHNKYKASGATREKAWLIGPKHMNDPAADHRSGRRCKSVLPCPLTYPTTLPASPWLTNPHGVLLPHGALRYVYLFYELPPRSHMHKA